MSHIKTVATGALVAAGLGLAALGIGAGSASASPLDNGPGIATWGGGPGWGHHGGWGGGPGWGPPPPPFYGGGYAGYGGWAPPPPCATGPLGLVHVCA